MSYTSKTRAILSAQGEVVSAIYQNTNQVTISAVELDHNIGRYEQSLTSLNFGSTSQCIIPNSDVCYQVFLHMELPNLVSDQTLPMGWGFAAIREITFTLGQSNISSIRLTGKSLYTVCMKSCQTKEQRNELLRLAGEPYNGNLNTKRIFSTIVLPLPWSSLCSEVYGFDTSILSNPIIVSVTLNDATSIYGGTGVRPAALTRGVIFLRQGVLADKSLSIKNSLMSDERELYQYGFIHCQSPSSKYITATPLEEEVKLEIQEFLHSDLYNIHFFVNYTDRQKSVNGSSTSPLACCELLDIELKYNGQTVAKMDGNSGRLINMLFDSGSSGIDDTILAKQSPYTAEPITSYIYTIPMGFMKNVVFEKGFDNVGRYSSQVFSLSFKPQRILPTDSVNTPYEVHFTYQYAAIAVMSGGVANLMFS